MEEAARALSALREWESFYVIVGSSGAALTGLQFVVMALIAEIERPSTGREISAFGTPTVIHFCGPACLGNCERTLALFIERRFGTGRLWIGRRCLWSNSH